ncbi:tape measure protein [Deefgea rivuli]|uniref:tape measure protein n=1 Tax=Deefgea rivuli TaxID=400948 RepID=UPI000484B0B3|nr:tape measure protein [Deefgea rivuli]
MANNEVQIRITGDGRVLVAEAGKASRALESIGHSAQKAGADTQLGFSKTRKGLESISNQLADIKSQMVGFFAASLFTNGLGGIIATNDALTNLDSRLKLVTNGSANLVAVQQILFAQSQSSQTSYQANADLYVQMARATKDLGVAQSRVIDFTQKVSKGLVVAGASTEGSKAALVQFSQAMQSGVLRGEEFNSINEQAPFLLDALAAGLGRARGELKNMADNGKLTADIVFPAMLKGLSTVDAQFAQMGPTVLRATQMLSDNAAMQLHHLNEAQGASAALAQGIVFVSNHLGVMAQAAVVAAGIVGVKYVGALAASTGATVIDIQAKRAALAAEAELTAGAVVRAERMAALAVQDMNRAGAAVQAAELQVASQRAVALGEQQTTVVVLAADAERYASTVRTIQGEIQLEQVRLRAQINEIGRAQRTAALAGLSLELAAATTGLARAEAALATAQADATLTTNALTAAQARLDAALVAKTAATGTAATATAGLSAAQGAAAGAATAMAGATTVAGRALALIGGPIGIAVGALVVLWQNWDLVASKAGNAAAASREAARDIKEALAGGNRAKAADARNVIADSNDKIQGKINGIENDLRNLKPQDAPSQRVFEMRKKILNDGLEDYKAQLFKGKKDLEAADKIFAEFNTANPVERTQGVATGSIDQTTGQVIGLKKTNTVADAFIADNVSKKEALSAAIEKARGDYRVLLQDAKDGGATPEYLAKLDKAFNNKIAKLESEMPKEKKSKGVAGAIHAPTDTAIASLQAKLETARQEGAGQEKLNEGEKEGIRLAKAYALAKDDKTRAGLQAQMAVAKEIAQQLDVNQAAKAYRDDQEKLAENRAKELAQLGQDSEVWQLKLRFYGMEQSAIEEVALAKTEARIAELEAQKVGEAGVSIQARLNDENERELAFYREKAVQQKAAIDARKGVEGLEAADKAAKDFAEQRKKEADDLKGMYTGVFQNMEDAMVNFTTGGKTNFKGMIDSMVSDLIRYQIRQSIIKPMSDLLGGTSSGGGLLGNVGGLLGTIGGFLGVGSSNVSAFGGTSSVFKPSFAAAKGFDVPSGVNPITQLHQEEMVLPAHLANPIRAMAKNGGGNSASSGEVTLHFSPTIDARGADAEAVARIEAGMAEMAKNFDTMVTSAMRSAMLRSRQTPQF